ncbi:MAG: hypothetical protein KAJ75_05705, partial [Alphaproteobacteria bacterium]|nr:hypothetical protein [Alphaproteobacteria bacterium]
EGTPAGRGVGEYICNHTNETKREAEAGYWLYRTACSKEHTCGCNAVEVCLFSASDDGRYVCQISKYVNSTEKLVKTYQRTKKTNPYTGQTYYDSWQLSSQTTDCSLSSSKILQKYKTYKWELD